MLRLPAGTGLAGAREANVDGSTERAEDRGATALLAALLLLCALAPVVARERQAAVYVQILLTVVVVAAVLGRSGRGRYRFVGLALGGPAIVAGWVGGVAEVPLLVLAARLLLVALFGWLASLLLGRVLRARRVSRNTITIAACAYLLLGVTWAAAHAALAVAQPEAYAGAVGAAPGFGDLTYFSMVTLTTLGYGDITPASGLARSLCLLEALVGQLYIAILVARLVGLQVAQSTGSGGVDPA